MKNFLIKIGACEEARQWAGEKSLSEIWATCERGDWMLWLAKKCNVDSRVLTAAKAECAATVIHLMKDPRSIAAVEAARSYGRGEISREELAAAASAADAAASAADAADAADASSAASSAADAAAYAAASAAAAYAAYAAYASSAAARSETLKKCAEIVREIITLPVI